MLVPLEGAGADSGAPGSIAQEKDATSLQEVGPLYPLQTPWVHPLLEREKNSATASAISRQEAAQCHGTTHLHPEAVLIVRGL